MANEPNNPDGLVGKFIAGMVATFGIWAACITALEVSRVEIDRGFVTTLTSNAVVVLGLLGLGLRNEIRGRAARLQLDENTAMTAAIQDAVAPETKT